MKRIVLIIGLCASALMAQTPVERGKPTDKPAIDIQAMDKLTKMNAFLKTLKTFGITSQSSKDEIVDTDMKIQKSAAIDVTVRLPDRFRAHIRGDERDLRFFYDGQTFSAYSADHNYYASTPAPPTVPRTLDAMRARHGTVFPLADFLHMAAGENLPQDITRAGYIGVSRVDGVECDHVAVRQPEVDWQVWIERSQTPVPRKIVITTKGDSTQPQYAARLSWDLSPEIDEKMFTFTPPADAVRIKFARNKDTGNKQ